MKHKLTKRLILYFSITLLTFSLIIGTLFSMMFMHYTSNLHLSDLKKRAVSIADTISNMPDFETAHQNHMQEMQHNNTSNTMGSHHGMMHGTSDKEKCKKTTTPAQKESTDSSPQEILSNKGYGYASYLRMLDEIAQSEVWIVDEQARTIDLYRQGQSCAISYEELPPEAAEVIEKIFTGEVDVSENFSTALGTPSVTAGAPIRDDNGQVIAALLLHRTLSDMNKAEHGGFLILALCMLTAFLLSVLLSILLARRFIRPLQRMEETAADLTQGDYSARTGITQDDEIGSLARSLDTLSSRLAEAAQESARLDKMRQDFITNISHELRTPITVLRGSLEVLQADLISDPQEKHEYLQQMMSNIIQLQRLVNDLLELTRLQNPDFSIEKSPINLTDALSDALHTAHHLADKKSIQLKLPSEPLPIALDADYGRIRQMFLIILDNAVKFSANNSTIEVTLQVQQHHWSIGIRDYGCGINAEELPHIFERFHRATDKSNPNGTGLGLAIANQIAERHDIQLRCESEPGKGTCFYFSR